MSLVCVVVVLVCRGSVTRVHSMPVYRFCLDIQCGVAPIGVHYPFPFFFFFKNIYLCFSHKLSKSREDGILYFKTICIILSFLSGYFYEDYM